MGQNWKIRLYESYISSGQAKVTSDNFIESYQKFKPYAKYLKKFLPTDKKISIIDLGCGSGGYLYHIKNFGYHNIKGVDLSSEQVEYANKAGLTEIERGDISSYLAKQPDGSTDVLLLMDVIEHFTRQELFDYLDLAFTKIKKGGKLIVHIPNSEGIFGNRIRYGDLTHELAFNSTSASQLFRTIGFSIINCFEDKPIVKSIIGFFRRILWEMGTFPYRILFMAETGTFKVILSQNMLVEVIK